MNHAAAQRSASEQMPATVDATAAFISAPSFHLRFRLITARVHALVHALVRANVRT